jgi:hypothetical protein
VGVTVVVALRRRPVSRGISSMPRLEEKQMLETIAVILVLMWLLGMVSSYTMGGFVHLLLLLALVVVVVRLLSGRRVLS